MKKSSLLFLIATPLLLALGWFGLRSVQAPARTSGPVARFTAEMRSVGELQFDSGNPTQGVKLETLFRGDADVSWDAASGLMRVRWSPRLELLMNGAHLSAQEALLESIPAHHMALRLSESGEPQMAYIEPLKNLPPDAAELVVNAGKMLLVQLAWKAQAKASTQGLDIWGTHTRTWRGDQLSANVQTTSAAKTQSGMRGTGQFNLRFDESGELLSVVGKQTSATGAALQLATSQTDYRLQRASVSPTQSLNFSLDGLLEQKPWIVVNVKALKTATLEARTQGWDLARVRREVDALRQNGKTSARDLLEVSQKLEDLLWLNEDLASQFASLALELGPDHPLFDEIVKALRSVGGAKSQAALQNLLAALKENENAATRLMLSLAFVSSPDLASQAALEDLASKASQPRQRQTAELALGQMAYQLRDSEPARARELVARYQDVLNAAPGSRDPREVMQALNVVGNSGQCENWSALEGYARSSNDDYASRALEALRFCRDPRVAPLYLEFFKRSERDRGRVIEAIALRAERQIYDAELFDGLIDWLSQKSNARSKLGPAAFRALDELSRLDPRARERFDELNKRCGELGLCAQ